MRTNNLLSQDLDHIIGHTKGLWKHLRAKKIFVTGGTGFFGKWLLESFVWVNDRLKLDAQMHVLSRDPVSFKTRHLHLAQASGVRFHQGDIRDFDFPQEQFDFIIHAATDASVQLNLENPLLMLDTIVEGTRRTLEFARDCRAKRFLLISSGAVYGKQPPDLSHTQEEYSGAPDTTQSSSAYGEAKRIAELMCTIYQKQYGIGITVARCFAFVGPYLNLDIHYAVGNFIRDALTGGPIHVSGDGTPCRSYLYAADLAIWLWILLLRGDPGAAYNVGSEKTISIRDLAYEVKAAFSNVPEVVIRKCPSPGMKAESYVPSIRKARESLGLDSWINLREALHRTIKWHQLMSL
ncbi:MAG: NAD-dependent epimerase/dehydratase family protein [Deltaproteobacteria bacterium]|jgi:nucleoside-diphosphate-sugar epimerase|nr:NAD-dependent epimerase/dehydratase family protein [Deltaproteobacteria bacterium]